MGIFLKKKVAVVELWFYSYMLKTPQYTIWVLSINEESEDQRTIILVQYMIPHNAAKELSYVMNMWWVYVAWLRNKYCCLLLK